MSAHQLELLVLRRGAYQAAEQRSLSRDVERGLLTRVRRGVYVERTAIEGMTPEERHLVAMRALAAVASDEPVFSHWSAAVALGLPLLERKRLTTVHVTLPESARRSVTGASVHLFPVSGAETVRVHGLLVTFPARTVVDLAAAAPFVEAVVTADGALHSGLRRAALVEALGLVGVRRAVQRIADVVGFAHPGSESAAESLSRYTMPRIGIAPLVLQQRFFDREGFVARSDFWDPKRRIAGEADGRKKYLDPALAPAGAGMAVWKEKRREDRLLGCVDRLARWGYVEAGSAVLLGRILAAVGLLPGARKATLSDYIAAARPFG